METLVAWGIADAEAEAMLDRGVKRKQELALEDQGKRADHPVVNPRTRCSKLVAQRELATDEGREKWRSLLLKDVYANSTVGPREAIW